MYMYVPYKYPVSHLPLSARGDGFGEQTELQADLACPLWPFMGLCPCFCPPALNPFFLALASADSAFYTFSASAFILLCFLFLYLSFLLLLLATYSFAVFMYAHSMHVCAHMHTFNIYVEVRGQLGNWFSSHHQVGARD